MARNQELAARVMYTVDEALVPINAALQYRDREPSRRWRAHYDLIRGTAAGRQDPLLRIQLDLRQDEEGDAQVYEREEQRLAASFPAATCSRTRRWPKPPPKRASC